MTLVLTAVVAGVLGTLAMDVLNLIFSRAGVISKIDARLIGRMAVGWMQGRLRYGHPSEMQEVANELLCGYVTHYLIGIGFAVPFVFGWNFLIGGNESPTVGLVYGVATTAASWFFVYPCMGFGVFGLWSPEGVRATLSSLANHLFYGIGLAVGLAIV